MKLTPVAAISLPSAAYDEHSVRSVLVGDEMCVAALDFAGPLGMSKSTMRNHIADLEPSDRHCVRLADTMGRMRDTIVLTESGALQLMFQSQKPEAKRLRKFVADLFVAWRRGQLVPAEQQVSGGLTLGQIETVMDERLAAMFEAKMKPVLMILAQSPRAKLLVGAVSPRNLFPYSDEQVRDLREKGFWPARAWLSSQGVPDEKVVSEARSLITRAVSFFGKRLQLRDDQTRTLVRSCGTKKVWLIQAKYLDSLWFRDPSPEARKERLEILAAADKCNVQGTLFEDNVIQFPGCPRQGA